ncbi:MAG: DNA mismatch repair protein MutT [Chloroflexi bacterium HGW-Chloroflexi-6]|nr:MAG: DNA mismatch repair protein MutT [Chloroflexi bacterium HGW-Chloroflexi-6]
MRLEDIRFCPSCATALVSREKFGQSRPVCPACGWVYFDDPKVAAAALIVQNGKILLVRRVNEPHRGQWTLPAGFINGGEDPARAAIRECLEETGLEVRITALLDIYARREHPRGADFVIFYQAEIEGGTLQPADDADAAEWFSPEDLPPLAFEATRYILDKTKMGRAR